MATRKISIKGASACKSLCWIGLSKEKGKLFVITASILNIFLSLTQ